MTAQTAIIKALRNRGWLAWSDLVLLVWQQDMKRFGMRGYANRYPDTKRIATAIATMVKRGLFEVEKGQKVGLGGTRKGTINPRRQASYKLKESNLVNPHPPRR